MELLIKLYTDKPSRLGVLYDNEFKAWKDYEKLIEKHGKYNLQAKIEVVGEKVNLALISSQDGSKTVYKGLSCNPASLKRLETSRQANAPMLFVHVFRKGEATFVAKNIRKEDAFFYEVAGFDVFSQDNL